MAARGGVYVGGVDVTILWYWCLGETHMRGVAREVECDARRESCNIDYACIK